jgi:hypothetical protein
VIDYFNHFEMPLQDKILAPILLDILRGSPTDFLSIRQFTDKGWQIEIDLSQTQSFPDLDFQPMFHPFPRPLHPDLPHNPRSAFKIRNRFQRFRDYYQKEVRWLYPRATHKSMSRSTIRDFESKFGTLVSDDPIFGQDDWERVYHRTGIELEGVVEMRQRWPTGTAKPRTYFAMGGLCYGASRFLQDFFTQLTNAFPSTHHIRRLQPHLLHVPIGDTGHFLVYDLSSFTSNMKQQRSFCAALADYFRGVEVVIVDERYGPLTCDLGDLLDRYNDICVCNPHLSYERSPNHLGWNHELDEEHMNASMLGIFGNLMCCTVAHFLTVSCAVDDPDEQDETAGDDGLIFENILNTVTVHRGIGFVGEFAVEKLYKSTDEGAVCLKRPLFTVGRSLELGDVVIPPCLATCISYLLGRVVDDRYTIIGLEEMGEGERVSTVGKALASFLTQVYNRDDPDLYDRALQTYRGWTRLVQSLVKKSVLSFGIGRLSKYFWPVDPSTYVFFSMSNPYAVHASVYTSSFEYFVRGFIDVDTCSALRFEGDEVVANSDQRLVLLERLGYLEKTEVTAHYFGPEAVSVLLSTFSKGYLPPKQYTYKVIECVPDTFLY